MRTRGISAVVLATIGVFAIIVGVAEGLECHKCSYVKVDGVVKTGSLDCKSNVGAVEVETCYEDRRLEYETRCYTFNFTGERHDIVYRGCRDVIVVDLPVTTCEDGVLEEDNNVDGRVCYCNFSKCNTCTSNYPGCSRSGAPTFLTASHWISLSLLIITCARVKLY